ncbi:MAG: pseudouridine synthase [bacterium]
MILAFHKPYGVLSQFTPDGSSNRPLAEFGFPKGAYPIGRLDADSEGLLLLSDESRWNALLLSPGAHVEKTYHVLVERLPKEGALQTLRDGILLDGRPTLPAGAQMLTPQPEYPPRHPPVRFRKNVPDFWIELRLREGRNRQVRRMTAAVGHPTLRLIRVAVGGFQLGGLDCGFWRVLTPGEVVLLTTPLRGRKTSHARRGPSHFEDGGS